MKTDLLKDLKTVINYDRAFLSPIVDTSVKDYNKLLNANSYQKGGWVLHMLRQEVGDQAFFDGIRKYYQKHQFSNALTIDLQKTMEEASGQNLNQFFQQWIFMPGHPQIQVSLSPHPKKQKRYTLTIRQAQKGNTFDVPFEIGFFFSNRAPVYKTFRLDKKESSFQIKLKSKPSEILLDPHVKLLFEEIK